MGKLYWSCVVLVVLVGLGIVITFGLKGKTVPKIKWSHFADAQEASQAVQGRLRQELLGSRLLFVGPHPDRPLHVETAALLIEAFRRESPSVVIADPRLLEKTNLKADVSLDLMAERDRFLEGISKVPADTRILVLAPNIYVTHLLPDSPVNGMLEDLAAWRYGVLSFMTFPASRDQEANFEFTCRTGEAAVSGFSELGCFIQGQARPHYPKGRIPTKTSGFLNHVRMHEFMFFLGQ
ncbi:MAG: hypothetical protein ACK5Y2_01795 [Bdellovibrionales bacterium]